MAITSISRIQHRRGLRGDLPINLAEGELGWCLDTRELFIGNSAGFGFNTQILTQYTPNDQVIGHAYVGTSGAVAQTGSSPDHPVIRQLGAILDDITSVKDYGAIGDGVTDDTAAINRAIADRYQNIVISGHSPLQARNGIFFPAGRYRITSPIKLFPNTKLYGEGINRSEIYMDSSTELCVAQTADSHGNVGLMIGTDSGTIPNNILINGMTLTQSSSTGDVLQLVRCNHVLLDNVALIGTWVTGNGNSPATAAIRLQSLGGVYPCEAISLLNTTLSNTAYGISCYDAADYAQYISIINSEIKSCFSGIYSGPNLTFMKISSSTFLDIDSVGLDVYGSNNIASIANTYINIAAMLGTYSIAWNNSAQYCSSIADNFNCLLQDRIYDSNLGFNIVANAPSMGVGNTTLYGPITLLDNQGSPLSTSITYDITQFTAITLNYTIVRDSTRRIGQFQIISDGSTAAIADSGTNLGGSPGITLGYSIVGTTLTVTYISTNTGTNATMKYTDSSWLA